jgi:hypothetical protein
MKDFSDLMHSMPVRHYGSTRKYGGQRTYQIPKKDVPELLAPGLAGGPPDTRSVEHLRLSRPAAGDAHGVEDHRAGRRTARVDRFRDSGHQQHGAT